MNLPTHQRQQWLEALCVWVVCAGDLFIVEKRATSGSDLSALERWSRHPHRSLEVNKKKTNNKKKGFA